MVKRSPANRSFEWSQSKKTGFQCPKCNSERVRCLGCEKIICRCDKRNQHIVGYTMYLCFGNLGEE